MLARELRADDLVILTDAANVEIGFGTDSATPISHITRTALRSKSFPAGSMGPKIDAACRFVEATRPPGDDRSARRRRPNPQRHARHQNRDRHRRRAGRATGLRSSVPHRLRRLLIHLRIRASRK